MLLVSGNDAANALASDTVGTERFVGAMNAQVAALGLHDFPLHQPGRPRRPRAVLVRVRPGGDRDRRGADVSRSSARSSRCARADLAATAGHPEFQLQSINLLLAMYPPAVGIKPGWTGTAGYCEVAMAVRDGHRLVSVLLNAPYSYSQSRRLLDWGFVQEGLPSTLPPPPSRAAPTPHRMAEAGTRRPHAAHRAWAAATPSAAAAATPRTWSMSACWSTAARPCRRCCRALA